MNKIICLLVIFLGNAVAPFAQQNTVKYKRTEMMIPMRDGVKLFTIILSPASGGDVPILIQRTPYGATGGIPTDPVIDIPESSSYYSLAHDGYIFVFQDIRGKYKSEGQMQIHQPLIHSKIRNAVDESTDTYDTIDWLIK